MKPRKKKTGFKWPPEDELQKMREMLSAPDFEPANEIPAYDAPDSEHFKYALCQVIHQYRRIHDLKQKDIAELLEIDPARVSDILHGKTSGFTIERLLGYAKKLMPKLKIEIKVA